MSKIKNPYLAARKSGPKNTLLFLITYSHELFPVWLLGEQLCVSNFAVRKDYLSSAREIIVKTITIVKNIFA